MAAPAASFALKLQDATVEAERLGELFIINREQMVATDKQRQGTREALTALRRQFQQQQEPQRQGSTAPLEGNKAWLLPAGASAALGAPGGVGAAAASAASGAFSQSCGTTLCFARYRSDDAVRLLEEELAALEARLESLRAEQKRLTARLADVGAAPRSASLDAMLWLRG